MSITGIAANGMYEASLAMIKSANKQPELALQLILKTTASIDNSPPSPQTAAASRLQASPVSAAGQIIDIIA